jgi:hypothetical protein
MKALLDERDRRIAELEAELASVKHDPTSPRALE